MMNYQSAPRNQRPKGLKKVKQALQLTLILAICIWLLYQIKPSNSDNKKHSLNPQSKLGKENRAINLGRKGNAAMSTNRNETKEDDDTGNGIEKQDNDLLLVLDTFEAIKENLEDEVSKKRGSTTAVQHEEMVNVTIPGHIEIEDSDHSFEDENGVPQDLESDFPKSSSHQEDVKSKEGRIVSENELTIVGDPKETGTTAHADSDMSKTVQEKSENSEA